MAKILHPISLLLLVGALVLGFMNRSKLVSTKGDLSTAKSQLATATQQASDSLNAEKLAKEELAGEKTKREAAEAELTPVKSKLNEAEAQVTALTASLEEQKNKVAELEARPAGGAAEVPQVNVAETEARVKELEALLTAAQAEAKAVADQRQAAIDEAAALRVAEQKRAQGLMRKGLQGTVLAYNPAWNFVVLNIGDRQGASAGAELVVARGDKMVGRVKITSVEPSTSIADVILSSVATGAQIAPGDTVIYPR
jgi:hypothetical protein